MPDTPRKAAEQIAHREHDFIQVNGKCPINYHAFSDLRVRDIRERLVAALTRCAAQTLEILRRGNRRSHLRQREGRMSRKFKGRYELGEGYPYAWDRVERKSAPTGDVVGLVGEAGERMRLHLPRFLHHDCPLPKFRLVLELIDT